MNCVLEVAMQIVRYFDHLSTYLMSSCPGEASESDPVLGRNLLTIFACDTNDEGATKPADKVSKIAKKRFDFR